MGTSQIELHFLHPRDSARTFSAEVDPQCTAKQAVDGLLAGDDRGPFLDKPQEGQPYGLVLARTNMALTPNMTFVQAGATHGDTLLVTQAARGA
jgi:hypothetical protein